MHRFRAAYAARFDYDLDRIVADLQRREAEHLAAGVKVVDLSAGKTKRGPRGAR